MAELRVLFVKSSWTETRLHNIEAVTGKLIVISDTKDVLVAALRYSGYIDTSILEVIAENADDFVIC